MFIGVQLLIKETILVHHKRSKIFFLQMHDMSGLQLYNCPQGAGQVSENLKFLCHQQAELVKLKLYRKRVKVISKLSQPI